MEKYDVLVIGGGPAGYTAAMYCARGALNTALLEKMTPGGQMATTSEIDNYPGFSQGIDGFTLATEMQKQAERFGAKSFYEEVTDISLVGDIKEVKTSSGKTYEAQAVILAPGASPRKLGVQDEDALRGRGVSYCATCDGAFFRGKTVAVIGGGDTAAADAVFLARFCKKVYLIHRRDTLRAAPSYMQPLKKAGNIEFVWDSIVEKILHEDKVSGLHIRNVKTGETKTLPCEGVFVAVGHVPNTNLFQGKIEMDNAGYLLAGEDTRTNINGVFAAGDARQKSFRQIVTAVSDGAMAAHMAEEFISGTQK